MNDILIALMGGALVGAVLTFIQFLINRKDAIAERESIILDAIKELSNKISGVEHRIDKEGADAARRNILLFDDELRRGEEHSEESYNQVLDDIKHYTDFCREHDDYENAKAVNAIEHINHCYMQVKAENKFI